MKPVVALEDFEHEELFKILESNDPHDFAEVKRLFYNNLNSNKESWLLQALFDYFLFTKSERCLEIIIGVREPHDKYVFDKLNENLRGPKKDVNLFLFSHIIHKHPPWLYKIEDHKLLPSLFQFLKINTDLEIMLYGLSILEELLFELPSALARYVNDILDVFTVLSDWMIKNCDNYSEDLLSLIKNALFSLFNKLYVLFPCNFLNHLRSKYSNATLSQGNKDTFALLIKPMMTKLRLHPHLVTYSHNSEIVPSRFRQKDAYDILEECTSFCLGDNNKELGNMSDEEATPGPSKELIDSMLTHEAVYIDPNDPEQNKMIEINEESPSPSPLPEEVFQASYEGTSTLEKATEAIPEVKVFSEDDSSKERDIPVKESTPYQIPLLESETFESCSAPSRTSSFPVPLKETGLQKSFARRLKYLSQCDSLEHLPLKGKLKSSASLPDLYKLIPARTNSPLSETKNSRGSHLSFDSRSQLKISTSTQTEALTSKEKSDLILNTRMSLFKETHLGKLELKARNEKPLGLEGALKKIAVLEKEVQLYKVEQLFQTHRLEIHTDKIRKLHGKMKEAWTVQEQNTSLKSQIKILEKGYFSASQAWKKFVQSSRAKKTESNTEPTMQRYLDKIKDFADENITLRNKLDETSMVLKQNEIEFEAKMQEELPPILEKRDIAQELKILERKLELSKIFEKEVKKLAKENLLLKELLQAHKDKIEDMKPPPAYDSKLEELKNSARQEVINLRVILDSKNTLIEGLKARTSEVEGNSFILNQQLAEERNLLTHLRASHKEVLKAKDERYESLKNLSQRDRRQIFGLIAQRSTLLHQIESKGEPSKSSIDESMLNLDSEPLPDLEFI